MGVNTSPEPASNIIVSLAEDLGVSGIIVLALFHPLPAAIIAAVALVLGGVTVCFILSRIRRYWLRRQARRAARRGNVLA
jgi:membrane protein YqaA with SNARE-associated domain